MGIGKYRYLGSSKRNKVCETAKSIGVTESEIGERWDAAMDGIAQVRKQQYHSYLQSPDWNIKRSTVLERDKYKCRICGFGDKLQVHHLTYDRVYDESLYDLVTVCEDCHTLIHTLD